MIGQTVSHYKIVEKLGGGGMGIVYKAQDLKLDRHVALKFLPPELTRDPEAKERFIHEAKAASALDHNNICTIHEIGETDDGQMFIVMASYEGETLKKKIEKGRLKIEEAADLAIQIAQGLAEAHQHGIVHRDVKPANILITKSGVAKIVDFGLAKLSGASKLTKTGSTLGTVAYMAPEQLQGSDVDGRADIFSVGVVLYEMLTGKTPFRGDHEAALMYSIMNEEPEPLQNTIADVPSELIHIVSRALEKSPADRYKTMDDLLVDLRRLRKETSKVSMPAVKKRTKDGFNWKHVFIIMFALIIVGVLIAVVLDSFSGNKPILNPDATAREIRMPVPNTGYPCLSVDGNWIAVCCPDSNGKRDVYFMSVSGGDVRRVTNDSSDYWEVGGMSRDGAWLACQIINKRKRQIALVPSQGGKTQILCAGAMPRWMANDQRILYMMVANTKSGKCEVWSIRRDGTDNHLEFVGPGTGYGVSMSLSPDSKSVAWIKTFPDFSNDIITHDLETGRETQITATKSHMDEVFWTKHNFIIYSSTRSGNFDLWICPANGGESVQITRSTSAKLRGQLSSDNTKLLYNEFQVIGNIRVMNLETGKVSAVSSDDLNRRGLGISPDNRFLSFIPTNAYPVMVTDRGIQVIDRWKVQSPWSLATDLPTAHYTAWSPDGQWIAFACRPNSVDEPSTICIVSPSSPAALKIIAKAEQDSDGIARSVFVRWFDERTVGWFTPKQRKTWMSSVEDPNPQQFYKDSTYAIPIQGGKYILFREYQHGHEGWWIDMAPAITQPNSRAPRRILDPLNISIAPDGRYLLYRSDDGMLHKVWLPEGKVEHLPLRIAANRPISIGGLTGSEGVGVISRDGKELAYVEYEEKGKVVLVENPFVWK